MLRNYLKQHYSLPNSLTHSEFTLLKHHLNRRLAVLPSANAKYSKMHASGLVVQAVQPQFILTLLYTADGLARLAKTEELIGGSELHLLPLPQRFPLVRLAENNSLYCCEEGRVLRFRCQEGALQWEHAE